MRTAAAGATQIEIFVRAGGDTVRQLYASSLSRFEIFQPSWDLLRAPALPRCHTDDQTTVMNGAMRSSAEAVRQVWELLSRYYGHLDLSSLSVGAFFPST